MKMLSSQEYKGTKRFLCSSLSQLTIIEDIINDESALLFSLQSNKMHIMFTAYVWGCLPGYDIRRIVLKHLNVKTSKF